MIEFSCPECQKELKVKPELAGRMGKCPGCGNKVCVPEKKVAANELLEDWLNEPVMAFVVEDPDELSSSLADEFPVRTTPPDWVLLPSRLYTYSLPMGGVSCWLSAIFFYFYSAEKLYPLSLLMIVLGFVGIGIGIYSIANIRPVLSITVDGLYYCEARKTIPWHEIDGAFYWNSNEDASFVSRMIESSLTGNSDGTTFIRIRFTPQGRQKHKRAVGFVVSAAQFVDDDMLIPIAIFRSTDLSVIDIAAEINKRVRAVRYPR